MALAVSDEPYTVTYDELEQEYVVEGPRIEKMLGYTNLESEKGFAFFQGFLKDAGILDKLEELGIADTAHFTNCVGLYDEAHKCTVSDMAVILEAAMDNDLCREVLGARTYETLPTADHPEGQILSNWFLRRIEDKDTGGIEVTGAKTGYVVESGNCAASCGETADGRRYICVTADAYSSWRAIYDHVALYKTYCSPADDTTEDGGAADPLVEPVAPTIKDTTEHESGASL